MTGIDEREAREKVLVKEQHQILNIARPLLFIREKIEVDDLQMEGINSLKELSRPGDYFTKINLHDAYLKAESPK